MRTALPIEPLCARKLLAGIGGIVWNDLDSSHTFDEAESALAGVTVYIDANHNGRLDSSEARDITDADGAYSFTGLPAGTYDIAQVLPAGLGQTAPGRISSLEHQFDIGLNYLSALTPAQSRAFESAAQRWEAILLGDLPDVNTDIGLVDDIAIDVSVIHIDGPADTLAQAEPTTFRAGSQLPSRGTIEFDLDDIDSLESDHQLLDIITHEMAHVLGFGTLWQQKNLLTGVGTSNPRFTGAQAKSAYNSLFNLSSSSGVPVEADAGAGTNLTHWRESALSIEQMTGFTEAPDVIEPISRITVAQFADLGYSVDSIAADQWDAVSGYARNWTPADAGVKPFTRRVVVTSTANQSDIDFADRANRAPRVTSFDITPVSPYRGDILTLSARADDPDADPIFGMTFYRESNGVPGLQPGDDTYIASKFTARRGAFAATTATTDLSSGSQTYYASAVDEMLFAGRRAQSIILLSPPSRPTRPNPLIATPQSATTVLLQWKDRSDNETGFHIEAATQSDFAPDITLRRFNVPAGSVSALIDGLPHGQSLYYRIRAYNTVGPSAYTVIGPIQQ